MAETPTLRLTLTDDERVNRNWTILDEAVQRLSLGPVAQGLTVEQRLHVPGDAAFGGAVTMPGNLDAGTLAVGGPATLRGALAVDGLMTARAGLHVEAGPVVVPAGSIVGSALGLGAAVQAVAISEAATTPVALGPEPSRLAHLDLGAAEEPGRWELVVAQVTLRVGLHSGAPARVDGTVALHRGSQATQLRTLTYSGSSQVHLDIPLTLVRVTQVHAGPVHDWSVWANRGGVRGSLTATFAQLAALQLR